jgi:hypothetical protein
LKLVGLMPVRNEDWCLGLTLRAALTWCDEVLVLLHNCTDRSEDIVEEIASDTNRLGWTSQCGEWEEMAHRQELLKCAREQYATHIALIDADEILTGNLAAPHEGMLRIGEMLYLPGYNLRGGTSHYHADGLWGQRWFSVVFADDPRLNWTGDRFHHREPFGLDLKPVKPIAQHQGGIMHLWGVSERRLKAKHALYKITERLRWPEKPTHEINAMYDQWKQKGSFARLPDEWWTPYKQWLKYLDVDKEPWQEAECQRLIEVHGADKFKGLDLFGVT